MENVQWGWLVAVAVMSASTGTVLCLFAVGRVADGRALPRTGASLGRVGVM
jgi:hypothetical protein